jgi:hypothetical protein
LKYPGERGSGSPAASITFNNNNGKVKKGENLGYGKVKKYFLKVAVSHQKQSLAQ